MTATEVQEHKRRAHEFGKRAQALREKVEGDLTPEQAKEIDGLLDDREAALTEAKRCQRLLDSERAAAEENKPEDKPKEESQTRSRDDLLRDGMLDYIRFGNAVQDQDARSALIEHTRDFSASIDTEGSYFMMPPKMLSEILKEVEDQTFMRQISRVLPRVRPHQSLGYPYADRKNLKVEWSSELTTAEPTDMEFKTREMKPNWLSSQLRFSRVLLSAETMNVEAYVRNELAIALGESLEQQYLLGHGGARPLGVFVANDEGIPASRDITTVATDAVGYDDIINTFYRLKTQYQRTSTWLVSREFMRRTALIKTTEGNPIWREGLVAGDPSMILNRPVYQSEYVPAGTGGEGGRKRGTGARQTGDPDHDAGTGGTYAAGDYMAILGNFNYYWILDSDYFSVQRLTELFAMRNQIGIINRQQTDGAPVLDEAFVRLKSK